MTEQADAGDTIFVPNDELSYDQQELEPMTEQTDNFPRCPRCGEPATNLEIDEDGKVHVVGQAITEQTDRLEYLEQCEQQSTKRGNEVISLGRELVEARAEIERLRQWAKVQDKSILERDEEDRKSVV